MVGRPPPKHGDRLDSGRTPTQKASSLPLVIRIRALPLSGALLLGLLLTLLPAAAAAAQPEPGQPAAPEPLPPDPAPAPPAPARLDAPAPAAPAPAPAAATRPLAGLETLPGGGWRLRFADGQKAVPPPAAVALAELARRLAQQEAGRFTLESQVSGPAADVSAARRLSLHRGIAVKEALVAGGLPGTRIDIRPLGRTEAAVDAVDILPPEVQRPAR